MNNYRDRRAGLILFGALEILIGIGIACFLAFSLVAMRMAPEAAQQPAGTLFLSTAMYGGLAATWIVLGAGSLAARRWARALSLIMAWFWLISGFLGLVFFLALMPTILEIVASAGAPRGRVPVLIMLPVTAILTVFYVLLPGTLILFYRSPHVKATCEARDSVTRWTDRCPLPVLALSLLLVFTALSVFWLPAFTMVMPVFGSLLRGPAALLVTLVLAAISLYLALGTYRLKKGAWVGALALFSLMALSGLLTLWSIDLMDLYVAMEIPEEQLETMGQLEIFEGRNLLLVAVAPTLFWLGFVYWTGRYFPEERA